MSLVVSEKKVKKEFNIKKEELLKDYKVAQTSRLCSLLGRKEVLNGKAKFGIFGDGKELAQIALAKVFCKGDWRSGYYRDQTLMFALGLLDPNKFFSQLYADTDPKREPFSLGRQMNCHFATRFIDEKGSWINQTNQYNSSADLSPTAGQMTKLLGFSYASKLYRDNKELKNSSNSKLFSKSGNEIAFGTIGNAASAEGLFWESINAAGVLQVPFLISIWDDDYGISVPNKLQLTKESISELVKGFEATNSKDGFTIFKVQGHNYEALIDTYKKAEKICRQHKPCLVHVIEMTQPQGHSTSGSQERYKNKDRLDYEKSIDCITVMKNWILKNEIASEEELEFIDNETKKLVEDCQRKSWSNFQEMIHTEKNALKVCFNQIKSLHAKPNLLDKLSNDLDTNSALLRKNIHSSATLALLKHKEASDEPIKELSTFINDYYKKGSEIYSSHLLCENEDKTVNKYYLPKYGAKPHIVDGRQIIQSYFDKTIANDPRVFILGEDVGTLGGVNLEFEGLSQKHGDLRVTDTGIREATILGQGIGAAMRGLKPIVDIQYLDYLIYALQGITDDLATLHYRTAGSQSAPVIIRTKGHRLEGIWHTGSPISMLLGSCRGVHLCVPRNSTQAVGLYQTLLQNDSPAIVIEVLNAYRLKEALPSNLGQFSIPLGKVEFIKRGKDITIVTYGACVKIAIEASSYLSKLGIELEIIDIQTILPFDLEQEICQSISKTNAVIFIDEDVPGGASSFMLQQVLEAQQAYEYLDSAPKTITSKDNRASYGSDGDYFCKPNVNDIIKSAYNLMRERYPLQFSYLL